MYAIALQIQIKQSNHLFKSLKLMNTLRQDIEENFRLVKMKDLNP